MMEPPRSRLVRALVALVALIFGRRRKEEPPRPELELESTYPGQPTEPDDVRAARGQKEEEEFERIRRRRAEPPPTVERDTSTHRGSETIVLLCLLGGTLGAAGFIVFYVAFPDTQLLGLTIGLGMAFLAAACILAAKRVLPEEKVAENYHYWGDRELQEDVEEIVEESAEGVSRRRLLLGGTVLAGATVGAAALFPAASLGPNVGERIFETPWRRGRRLVNVDDEPITARDIPRRTFETAFPEGTSKSELGSSLVVVRIDERDLALPPERRAGAPEGILAFSKICPHAGCAISIYRTPLHDPVEPRPALVCPCHFSTFDPARGGVLLFGPAGRDLPQLPLRIGDGGVLEAADDFFDAIGPSYPGTRLRPDEDES